MPSVLQIDEDYLIRKLEEFKEEGVEEFGLANGLEDFMDAEYDIEDDEYVLITENEYVDSFRKDYLIQKINTMFDNKTYYLYRFKKNNE